MLKEYNSRMNPYFLLFQAVRMIMMRERERVNAIGLHHNPRAQFHLSEI